MLQLLPWAQAQAWAESVRRQVFIEEQQIDEADEWDAQDAQALHAVVLNEAGMPLATGRMFPDSQQVGMALIGRMAVVKAMRGRGLGKQVLQALMQAAKQAGFTHVKLHAQTSAQAFYAAQGFVPEGDVYDEVGIAHINMCAWLI